MKKLIAIFLICTTAIGCQTPDTETMGGTLNIPDRFHGQYVGNATGYEVIIEAHKLIVKTPEKEYKRTEGTTTTDNGTTLYKADLNNGEKLVLLYREGCCIGVSLFAADGKTVFDNDFYNL